MKLSIQFKDYLRACNPNANQPVSVARLLAPFGIERVPSDEDDFLLMGHVLDGLAEQFLESEDIDPEVIILMADELGCEVLG